MRFILCVLIALIGAASGVQHSALSILSGPIDSICTVWGSSRFFKRVK